jgi:Tol biopolymer transport system component
MESRLARGLFFAVVLVVLCATAGPAWASFPGSNGRIVYGWAFAAKSLPVSLTSIRAVDPTSRQMRVLRDCPVSPSTVPPLFPRPDCQVTAPRYSPDGLRVAFASVRISQPAGQPLQFRPGLATMASDGAALDEHPTAHGYERLAWSPAGDRFLLERLLGPPPEARPGAVFLASLDGTELSQATPDGSWAPDWSSRGQIAFARRGNIYVTRLGGRPRRLTKRGGHSPSWSPQGTKLAFVRHVRSGKPDIYGGGQPDIYLLRRDGRGLRRLTRRGGQSPAWSPDGKWIAFIRAGDLYVIRTTGRGLRRLVDESLIQPEGLGPQVTSVDWQALPLR